MADHRRVLAIGVFVCLGACQTLGPSEPPLTASLRTDSAEIGVRHSGIGYGADIGFVYTNTTSGPVSKTGCGGPPFPDLQKKVNDNWVYAYYPIYLMCLTKPDFKLESGQSFRGVLQFGAFEPGHNTGPELRVDSIDGIYRLQWIFVEGTDASAKEARRVESTSNEFRMILKNQ
ncbi:MAG: hypothetical protein M3037_14975 [Gemmatimonadota bacterium]|nr:hypothetical protein [Gemmatimonadota bacterium]